jgi:hypothetical protein
MVQKLGYRVVVILLAAAVCYAESAGQVQWQRTEPEVELGLKIFHSTKVIGLPTSEVLEKGDFEFEISHRFVPPVNDGYEALYGFDGPVQMRLAVGYTVFDNWQVMLGRSSIDDNTELRIRHRFLEINNENLPTLVGIQAGVAWNPVQTSYRNQVGDLVIRPRSHERHMQYFGQMIIDTKPWSRLAVGIVPSFAYNRDIWQKEIDNTSML